MRGSTGRGPPSVRLAADDSRWDEAVECLLGWLKCRNANGKASNAQMIQPVFAVTRLATIRTKNDLADSDIHDIHGYLPAVMYRLRMNFPYISISPVHAPYTGIGVYTATIRDIYVRIRIVSSQISPEYSPYICISPAYLPYISRMLPV